MTDTTYKLNLKATDTTPYVAFEPDQGCLELSGESYPENVADFYDPILKLVAKHLESGSGLKVAFRLTYFNTSSAKYLYDLLYLLEGFSEKQTIKVIWYYDEDDELMMEHGEDFQADFNLNFELLEVSA